MIRRGISATHFSSLTPACGFGCVTAALIALSCDARLLLPLAGALLVTAGAALKWRNFRLLLVLLVSAGVLIISRHDLAQRWPGARNGERVVARCQINSLPQVADNGVALTAECHALLPRLTNAFAQGALNLSVRLPPQAAAQLPRAGENWQWLLELQALQAPLNPGMVDIERQWYRERLHGLARLRPSAYTRRLTTAAVGLLRLRASVADAIAARVDDRDARALIAALAVGATGDLTRDQWRVFATTGITHLIAISGMHVTAFALVAIAIARRLWRHSPPTLRSRVDRERFAVLLGIAVSVCYAALAGMSVPTQRTLVMLVIAAAARLAARRIAPAMLLSLAAMGVLLIDPYAPLAAGFWLSFVAVGVLMGLGCAPLSVAAGVTAAAAPPAARGAARLAAVIAVRWQAVLSSALGGARLQLLIVLAMMPVTLALFGSVPLAGLLVNLLAIPLFGLALVPLTLLGMAVLPTSARSIELAAPLWHLAEQLWVTVAPWLQRAADLPGALWQPDVALPWLLVSPALVLCVALRLPLRLRLTALAALALPLLWHAHSPPPLGGVAVTILDTGMGTAVILRSAGHALLFDTADVHGAEGTAVRRLILPALRAQGLQHIDRLVVSNMSASHIVGAATLLSSIAVTDVRSAARWSSAGVAASRCSAAEHWRWDDVDFSWLDTGELSECVLHVRTGDHSFLLTGNIDAAGEQELLRHATALHSDVVLVARHGSLQASTAAFIEAVRPHWAVVVNNAAVPSVADRWRGGGAQWVATHDCGALQFTMSRTAVTAPTALTASWRWPWRAPCPRR